MSLFKNLFKNFLSLAKKTDQNCSPIYKKNALHRKWIFTSRNLKIVSKVENILGKIDTSIKSYIVFGAPFLNCFSNFLIKSPGFTRILLQI